MAQTWYYDGIMRGEYSRTNIQMAQTWYYDGIMRGDYNRKREIRSEIRMIFQNFSRSDATMVKKLINELDVLDAAESRRGNNEDLRTKLQEHLYLCDFMASITK